jgi:hypothetical protein
MDAPPARPGATGLKAILRPVIAALIIGGVFVSVYLAAFHAAKPHDLPVAVVGTSAQARQVADGLQRGLPGGFSVEQYADEAAARTALTHRKIYAAYIPAAQGPVQLLYAGANGPTVTATVTAAFSGAAQASGETLAERDILPASAGDTRGMSVFYAGFGIVLAGFLFAMNSYQSAPRLQYRWRMTSVALFSILGGLMVALITGSLAFAALPGPFLSIAFTAALMAAAISTTTMAFMRLFGPLGISLSTMVLLTVGNSTSGGSMPPAFLPGWLRPLSGILPVGVGVRAIQGISHFHNDGFAVAVPILAAWTLLACLAIYWSDVHAPRRRANA